MMKKSTRMLKEASKRKAAKKLENEHKAVDEILLRNEIKISKLYDKLYREVNKKFLAFYEKNKNSLEEKLNQYKSNEITKEEYRNFIVQTVYLSKEWQNLVDVLVDIIIQANILALKNISSRNLPDIYISNYNKIIKAIGGELLDDSQL